MVKKFEDDSNNPNRALQIYLILIGAARSRQVLTYDIVSKIIGYKGAGVISKPLGHIMFWCRENNLPSLTTLIVNSETGLPGDGLTQAADLNSERERVFDYPWFDLVPPTPAQLQNAFKNGGGK